jgi:hypothetical protein
MERCGAENPVKDAVKGQTLQVGSKEEYLAGKTGGEIFPSRGDHVARKIQANHTTLWQLRKDFGGELTGSTTGIEDKFVAT